MDVSGLATLGWKEILIAVCAALVIYIAFTIWRMSQIRKSPKIPAQPPLRPTNAPPTAYTQISAVAAYQNTVQPASFEEPHLEQSPSLNEPDTLSTTDENISKKIKEIDGDLLILRKDRKRLALVEQELDQTRKEVGSLRAEIMMLREDLKEAIALTEAQMKIQPISPIYHDAMRLAQEGRSALDISQHCSISLAEAELVTSLMPPKKEEEDR